MDGAIAWRLHVTGALHARRVSCQSELRYFLGLQAFGSFDQFEFYRLTLIESAVAIALYGAEVDKYVVVAFLAGNKAKSLGIVKPFYRAGYTITHTTFLGFPCCSYYALPSSPTAEA
jgi:hypothetical protein